jgi:hypothetical protein
LPMNRTSRPMFHKSDTFHKDTAFQWHHWTVYVVVAAAAAAVRDIAKTFGKTDFVYK